MSEDEIKEIKENILTLLKNKNGRVNLKALEYC